MSTKLIQKNAYLQRLMIHSWGISKNLTVLNNWPFVMWLQRITSTA